MRATYYLYAKLAKSFNVIFWVASSDFYSLPAIPPRALDKREHPFARELRLRIEPQLGVVPHCHGATLATVNVFWLTYSKVLYVFFHDSPA